MQVIPRVDQGLEFAAAQAADPALEPLFQQAVSADPQFRMKRWSALSCCKGRQIGLAGHAGCLGGCLIVRVS